MTERAGTGTLAAVLAGGAGARLGGEKAALPLAGRPLAAHAVAAALAAGLETVAVAKPASALPDLPCERVAEPAEPRHPLCGILAALEHSGGRPVLALACDMPFLTPPLLAWLASLPTHAALELDGSLQPLPGLYLAEDAAPLAAALRERAPLRAAVARLSPWLVGEQALRRFGDPARLCFNVNDREAIATAERLLGGRGEPRGAG
jgi:molybdopterin-guanine dinucleotide biosynthesis protein A